MKNIKSLHLSVARQVAIIIKFYGLLHFMRSFWLANVWERLSAEIMASKQ